MKINVLWSYNHPESRITSHYWVIIITFAELVNDIIILFLSVFIIVGKYNAIYRLKLPRIEIFMLILGNYIFISLIVCIFLNKLF